MGDLIELFGSFKTTTVTPSHLDEDVDEAEAGQDQRYRDDDPNDRITILRVIDAINNVEWVEKDSESEHSNKDTKNGSLNKWSPKQLPNHRGEDDDASPDS